MNLGRKRVVNYPSVEQIIKIHNRLIEDYRDSEDGINRGIISEGNIYWNIEFAKKYRNFEKNVKSEIFHKATYLMIMIFVSHPFVDGNKRTGFFTYLLFLEINGIKLTSKDTNYENYVNFFKRASFEKDKIEENVLEFLQNYSSF